ncbi:cobalt ABC transporter permease [Oceanobacillus arenosus]|uniref:Cobalt ABC transporter permease n=1 Tax=Oceanobacillus arenosus TaxID=1229153 RepID=A0A3D8PP22_9BACI|nr:energy-coupling factor transporter transmembrane component T [Oceanobacillus arenosus]RDW16999.1 cobalt ABC transporter permease [Oceanobacillus arenosus]
MEPIHLYTQRKSWISQIDPLSKLLFAFVSIFMTYLFSSITITCFVLLISIVLLMVARVLKKIVPLLAISFTLLLSIIIVQGLTHPTNETPLLTIGSIVFYQEGLTFAFLITLRVFNMLAAFGVLILTTKPDDLMESLMKQGMSPKISYVFLSVFQLIPQMRATLGKITDAQRSRGMETEGSLMIRIKAFFPLIGPVVLSSLNMTKERAIALEVRGFSSKGKKTFLIEEKSYFYPKFIKCVLVTLLIAAIVWRIVG